MSRKTVYYHDPLHDDFAPTNGRIHLKQINADFPYEHKGPLWNALAFVVYRMVMTPFLFLYCKLVFGLRIENRKALRELPDGYFLYGNHTNTLADAFIPTLLAFPRRANIVTAADTVSIPCLRNIVQMLGAVPLADTIDGTRQFLAALHRRLERRQPIMIFDDSLSAVDTETDAKIRAELERRFGSASIILISHRITTLAKADQILVLDKGRIAERGTHDELVAANGIYRKIYDIQTAGAEEAAK